MEMNEEEYVVAGMANVAVEALPTGRTMKVITKLGFVFGRMMFLWWSARKVLFVLCLLALITPSLAEVANGKTQHRVRREGFGPFEEDQTLNTISELIQTVVKEEEKLVNVTIEFLEKSEEKISTFITSRARVIVWVGGIIAALFVLRLTWPCVAVTFRFLYRLVCTLIALTRTLTCCMWCCSLAPFVYIRNKRRDWILRERDNQVEIGTSEELTSMNRTVADIEYDQYGPHVKSSFGEKVYFARSTLDQSSFLALASAPPFERMQEGRVKETVLSRSVARPLKQLPAFQGYFTVDGQVVGHCCRITYKGKSCLLTAYHVLSYNRRADIILNVGDKSVRMSDVRVAPVAFSRETDFDYIVLQVPDVIFSKLGMQRAKMANHITHGTPVVINQIMDGRPCYTIGLAQKADRPWMISYGASTVEGTSGAPILNVKHEVVGVHIEGGSQANVGVVPELLRNFKESPQNGDLNGDDERSTPVDSDYEETEEEMEARIAAQVEFEEYQAERYKQYAVKGQEIMQRTNNWAEIMDQLDEDWWETHTGDREFYQTYVSTVGTVGKHVGAKIKGDRYRKKESPWTCTKCMTLHLKAGYNCKKCGYSLKPSTKEVIEEKKEAIANKFPYPVEKKILEELDSLKVKYANLEALIQRQLQNPQTHRYGPPADVGASGPLPKQVTMDKKLYQALQTTPGAVSPMGESVNKIRPAQNTVSKLKEGDFDNYTVESLKKVEMEKVDGKRKRSRKGKANKKETATVREVPAVPLNSISPSQDGVNTTSGVKKNSSLKDPKSLEDRTSDFIQRVKHASLRFGSTLKQ